MPVVMDEIYVDVDPQMERNSRLSFAICALGAVVGMILGIFANSLFLTATGFCLGIFFGAIVTRFAGWNGDCITIKGKKGQIAWEIYQGLDTARRYEARIILKKLVEIENNSNFSRTERDAVSERLEAIQFLQTEMNREIFAAKIKQITDADLLSIRDRGFKYDPL